MMPVKISVIGYIESPFQEVKLKSPLSGKVLEYALPKDFGYFGFGPVPVDITEGDRQFTIWLCQNRALDVECEYPIPDREIRAHVERFVTRLNARMDRVASDTSAREATVERQKIPDRVRSYVWRRDRGRCVQCGSTVRLEYDHIIPIIEGGSSTDRNIQLLCEDCNRRKGRSI